MRRIALFLGAALFWACDDGDDTNTVVPVPDGAVDDARVTPLDATGPDSARPDAAPPADAGADAGDAALVDAGDAGVAACANRMDDDGDGLIDFPLDPGCADAADTDEVDPANPACSDGDDNDGDGRTDFPDDPGCADTADPNEASACGATEHDVQDISNLTMVQGTTVGRPAVLNGCRTNNAPEAVFRFTLRENVERIVASTDGSAFDTLLGIRKVCDDDEDDQWCNDDEAEGVRTSYLEVPLATRGDYYVIVDGFLEEQGPFTLTLRAELPDGLPCPPEGGIVQCRLGSACVDGLCAPAACANRQDDDVDGRLDYPNDPGCESPSDDDETDPEVPPQCANGIDDDGDGDIDYPDDENCRAAADDDEFPPPACSDRRDNDQDGLIDLGDPGCQGDPERDDEFNVPACRNAVDDDGDGAIDYPTDPGCAVPDDQDETDPDPLPACSNGEDDDGDGLTDWPEDVESCLFAADPTEDDPCARAEPELIAGLATTRGNTNDAVNDFEGTCGPGSGAEDLLLWRVAEDRPLAGLVLDTRDSDFDTVVYARAGCGGPELGCDDDSGDVFGSARLELGPAGPGSDLWIHVDAGNPRVSGIWRMRITARLADGANCGPPGTWTCADGLACRAGTCVMAACANGEDDDGDGVIDYPFDPGCDTLSDDDETDPAVPPQCANGFDDDGDGLTDFGEDPRCEAAADDFEGADCADGRDNDGDGNVDYDRDGDGFRDINADFECVCANDELETRQPACQDGCDNDGDGLIDLEDIGCDGPDDTNEFNPPQCSDGVDNNENGVADYPADPGCNSEDDPLEETLDVLPACADGIDNDDDGFVDFAGGDDGCIAAADDSELGPCDEEQPLLPPLPVRGSTFGGLDQHTPGCGFSEAPDRMFRVPVPYPAQVTVDTLGSSFDTVLYARRACTPTAGCPLLPPPDGDGGPAIDLGAEDAGVEPDADVLDAGLPDAADLGPIEDAGVEADAADALVDAAVEMLGFGALGEDDLGAEDFGAEDFGAEDFGAEDMGPPVELDMGPPVELDMGPPIELDMGPPVELDASADAGIDAAADAGPPMCMPQPTEIACNDDAQGVQSRITFQWEGGDVFVVVDGFGGNSGDYTLNVRATYPAGGQCGPEQVPYAVCADGTACEPDDAAGFPTCQPAP